MVDGVEVFGVRLVVGGKDELADEGFEGGWFLEEERKRKRNGEKVGIWRGTGSV